MRVEFVGQSARNDRNISAGTSRLLNLYRVPVTEGDDTRYALEAVPGMSEFADLGGVFMRAAGKVGDDIFAVSGGRFYRVQADGTVTNIGAIVDGDNAVIADANGFPAFTVGANYYFWDGVTLSEPTPGPFSNFGSVTYIAGRTVQTESAGRRFGWSDTNDPETLGGLSFATAEQSSGDLIRACAINGLLCLFKADSFEGWQPVGGSTVFEYAFNRHVGLRDFRAFAELPGGVFFVGNDGKAHICTGPDFKPVSTPAVEEAIKTATDMRCFFAEWKGQQFCTIRFADRPAWVYDLSTGEWHERAEGTGFDAWTAVAAAKLGADWYVATEAGRINLLDDVQSDMGQTLARRAVSRTLRQDGARFVLRELELFGRRGYGDATVRLRMSRDGGNTWGLAKAKTLSALAGYDRRVIWRNLGQFRQATAEFTITDAVDVPLWADGRVA